MAHNDAMVSEAAARVFATLGQQTHFVEIMGAREHNSNNGLIAWLCDTIELGAASAAYDPAVRLVRRFVTRCLIATTMFSPLSASVYLPFHSTSVFVHFSICVHLCLSVSADSLFLVTISSTKVKLSDDLHRDRQSRLQMLALQCKLLVVHCSSRGFPADFTQCCCTLVV